MKTLPVALFMKPPVRVLSDILIISECWYSFVVYNNFIAFLLVTQGFKFKYLLKKLLSCILKLIYYSSNEYGLLDKDEIETNCYTYALIGI